MTDELFKDQDAASKRSMCAALNKDMAKKRDAALEREFHAAAMAVLRSRVVVVDDVASVKAYMESASKDGLKARTLYMDISQYPSLAVSGKWSKNLARQPTQEMQKKLATNVKVVPVTPITGSLILRSCHVSLESFNTELAKSFAAKYQKTMFVPVDVPRAYERAMRSAAARSLGPSSVRSEKSGIEFHFRSVGGRSYGDDDEEPKKEKKKEDDEEEEEEEDDEELEVDESGEGIPIEAMSTKQLKGLFGRDALNMMGAMFQHSSQIGESARFQPADKCVMTKKPNGKLEIYRKSQIHPTAVHSVLNLALASNAAGIAPGECFVQLSGGTPEPIIGAIIAGFTKVFYVSQNASEHTWMQWPSAHEEKVHDVDYTNYVSPNPESPDQGMLAVEAAKMLAPFIRNFIFDTPNSLMVPSPTQIIVPPLQTFTFIAVTGKVVARTIHHDQQSEPSKQSEQSKKSEQSKRAPKASSKASSSAGPGSATGDKPPATPKVKGTIKPSDDDDDEEEDDAGDDSGEEDDEEGEGDMESEMAALEALSMANTPTPKKKGRKRKAEPKAESSGKKNK